MKRKYYIIIITLLVLPSLNSCKKFLATSPTDFLSPSNYYETADQLTYAKASVYSILGANAFWGAAANYLLAFNGDEGFMNRYTLNAGPYNYNFASGETYTTNYWNNLYNGINRANVVLENLDKNPSIPQGFRDQIRGEVTFLRGYYYFMLVQYFGGVPLRTTATASVNDVDRPKASVKEVYDQILADMTAAEPLVQNITAVNNASLITKSAVRGLLARVCLTMAGYPLKDVSKYADAKMWASKVINDPESHHALNPSYANIFINYAADQYDINESIWEAEFWGNKIGDTYVESTNNGIINGPTTTNPLTGAATAYMFITAKYYNIFEPGDARKWWSIAHYALIKDGPNGNKTLTNPPATEALKYGAYPAKWRREYETLLPKSGTLTPENTPLLRFADVLLMFAEADNEVSGHPTPEAIAAVNAVRRRGWTKGIKTISITNGGSGYTSAPTVTFSGGGATTSAAATVTVAGGIVTGITLARDPSAKFFYLTGDYTSTPTITINGGGGAGATATATVYQPTDADLTTTQTASKDSFLSLIQDERMRELGMEGLRKSDLTRWGILIQTLQAVGNTATQDAPAGLFLPTFRNATDKYIVWPIPSAEILYNRQIVQNPGW